MKNVTKIYIVIFILAYMYVLLKSAFMNGSFERFLVAYFGVSVLLFGIVDTVSYDSGATLKRNYERRNWSENKEKKVSVLERVFGLNMGISGLIFLFYGIIKGIIS